MQETIYNLLTVLFILSGLISLGCWLYIDFLAAPVAILSNDNKESKINISSDIIKREVLVEDVLKAADDKYNLKQLTERLLVLENISRNYENLMHSPFSQIGQLSSMENISVEKALPSSARTGRAFRPGVADAAFIVKHVDEQELPFYGSLNYNFVNASFVTELSTVISEKQIVNPQFIIENYYPFFSKYPLTPSSKNVLDDILKNTLNKLGYFYEWTNNPIFKTLNVDLLKKMRDDGSISTQQFDVIVNELL